MTNQSTAGEDYEILVKAFLEQALGEKDIEVYHKRKYTGVSGQEYEIDLSFAFKLVGVDFLVVVECKYHSRRVEVGHALEFSRKLRDIGAHKGILVSKMGFQEGVLNIARADGIALVKINPPIRDIIMSSRGSRVHLDFAFQGFQELDEGGEELPLAMVMFTREVSGGLAIPRSSISRVIREVRNGQTGGLVLPY